MFRFISNLFHPVATNMKKTITPPIGKSNGL